MVVASRALYAVLAALAAPTLAAVHERLATVPSGWSLVNEASDSTPVTLSVALVRENLDKLETHLMSRSTPGHAQYGQWLDKSEIESYFPTVSDAAVVKWLQQNGISQIHREGSHVNFATTVGVANKLLQTTFGWYQKGTVKKLRTVEYSIPDQLRSTVDLVSPTVYFGNIQAHAAVPAAGAEKRQASVQSIDAACSDLVTPECLKELYNLGDYQPSTDSGSRIAFSSFLNQSASYADLAQYEQHFGIPAQNFSVELINGGVNTQDPATIQDGEADLDAQMIVAVSHPLPITEYITGGSPPFVPNLDQPTAADNFNEPYLPYYEYLLSKPNSDLPQVISNSYGDDEQTVPEYYAKRVCNLIGLMGLRGVSVLESSGDTGVGSACQSNHGKKSPQFTPTFPGTCPWITAVGGTQSYGPEIAWTGSSGGFSNYFPRAWYQELAVEDYLNNHISEATKEYYRPYTNFHGRGFPDVAAHSLTPE